MVSEKKHIKKNYPIDDSSYLCGYRLINTVFIHKFQHHKSSGLYIIKTVASLPNGYTTSH